MSHEYFTWLDEQAHFDALDEHPDDLRRPGQAAIRSSATTAAAPADRPLAPALLPGGRSALIFRGTADCHPGRTAARWQDGQRICWPCTEQLLKTAAPALWQEPGA